LFRALPLLIVPISLIVLIYGGIATPTESGAQAVFLALLLGFVGYRTLNLGSFKEAMVDACISTGTIIFFIASSFILNYSFSMTGIIYVITNILLEFKLTSEIFIFDCYTYFACFRYYIRCSGYYHHIFSYCLRFGGGMCSRKRKITCCNKGIIAFLGVAVFPSY